jgi:hypothetical protein
LVAAGFRHSMDGDTLIIDIVVDALLFPARTPTISHSFSELGAMMLIASGATSTISSTSIYA